MTIKKDEKTFLSYKGKPMVRRGNVIYYGSFEKDFIIQFTINDMKKLGQLTVANHVTIALKDTRRMDKDAVKTAEREGLYRAVDIAEFWLKDALGEV